MPLVDVVRARTSEIEHYSRVQLGIRPGIAVSGQAAADVVHLLAEIIENATAFSPGDTSVHISGSEVSSSGVLIEVRDEGVGISPSRLTEINWRLDNPPDIDVSVSQHMGLFAVSRLAARHGVRVRLQAATPQGLSALIWLPGNLTGRETSALAVGAQAASSGPAVLGRPPVNGGRGATARTSNWFRAKRPSGRSAHGDGAAIAARAAIDIAPVSASQQGRPLPPLPGTRSAPLRTARQVSARRLSAPPPTARQVSARQVSAPLRTAQQVSAQQVSARQLLARRRTALPHPA